MATTRSYPAQAVELETFNPAYEMMRVAPAEPTPVLFGTGRQLGSYYDYDQAGRIDDDALPAPSMASRALEKWNYPRGNAFRVAAVFWSLFVSGANDAAYGALIPYLETYYDLSYLVVSLIFLSPFVGFMVSAAVNNWLHMKIGQRWIGFLCGACHTITYLILSQHPPYGQVISLFGHKSVTDWSRILLKRPEFVSEDYLNH
ncbi:hypothetical protein BKA56DRAFT_672363 [Ilyonectria sp. MPI-CAGE-AT-0026]|nr:hypothetical protein BKA56DRAFT_672363 [Ilyonectria sp. MPI-CAGE-AT-0026]